MAKTVDSRALALQALSRAIADPAPKPLHGTAAKPGILIGTTPAAKKAAELCLASGWIAKAGEQAVGKKRVELYRITPEGVAEAIENNETTLMLRDMLAVLDDKRSSLGALQQQLADLHGAIAQQEVVLQEMVQKLAPPDLSGLREALSAKPAAVESKPATVQQPTSAGGTDWQDAAVAYIRDFSRRNPHIDCPLPELFHKVAEPRRLTIGQFHDGLRDLLRRKVIQLHLYSGSDYALEEGEYALIVGKEIKYYVTAS